jgi:hypothetical protein
MQIKKIWLINFLKIFVVVLLLWWMGASGRLSWEQLIIVLRRPDVLVMSLAVWCVGPVLLGTWRWWLLLSGAGLHCDFIRAMRLQLIGFFFNTAMPGAVGGDIVKAIYIVRDQKGRTTKTPAMLSVLLDRIVGLIGLFLMGVTSAAFSYETLAKNPVTAQLMTGLGCVVALSVVFLAIVFIPYKNNRDPVDRILSWSIPPFKLLRGIYTALRSYRAKPGIILGTIGISVLIQMIFLYFMGYIGRVLYGDTAFDPALLAPIFPFGILVTALPLAPGGLGVGHAAFDRLFSMVGLPGGANVFNVYVLTQLILNLIGVIPYLYMKSDHARSTSEKFAET